MKEASEIPNVVNCCNRGGLYEKLENLQERCVFLANKFFFFFSTKVCSILLLNKELIIQKVILLERYRICQQRRLLKAGKIPPYIKICIC